MYIAMFCDYITENRDLYLFYREQWNGKEKNRADLWKH